MRNLKLISTIMLLLGGVAFIGGIAVSKRELMEIGLSIGVAGVIGYAIVFVVSSTTIARQKSGGD